MTGDARKGQHNDGGVKEISPTMGEKNWKIEVRSGCCNTHFFNTVTCTLMLSSSARTFDRYSIRTRFVSATEIYRIERPGNEHKI